MAKRLVAVTLVLAALAGAAAAADEDPIDVALDACLGKPDGQTTQGMVECLTTAYHAWDAALNASYQAVIKTLAPEEAANLRAAQRAWIGFRDAEAAFLASLVTPERGTIMRIFTNEMMVNLVKDRVGQLRLLEDDVDY